MNTTNVKVYQTITTEVDFDNLSSTIVRVLAGGEGSAGPAGPTGPTGASPPQQFGQINKMTSGTITIATQGTYQSTGLTANLASGAINVGLGTAPFSVKNIGTSARWTQVTATYDASVTGPATVLGLQLALNGNPLTDTECRATTSATGAIAKLHTMWLINLQPNDEVQLQVANHSSTTAINFQRGRIVAVGL